MSRAVSRQPPSPALDVAIVAAYLTQRTGVSFAGSRGPQLIAQIEAGARRAGVGNGRDYVGLLSEDPAAFSALAGQLTVGETYFFRERAQLDLLRMVILPDLRNRGDVVRLWSAGCSTGEEAYTLAIVLEEEGLGARCQILATDLSAATLATADAGLYRPRSLRGVTEGQRRTYFTQERGGFRVSPRLRPCITFRAMNLLDPSATPDGIDVVFCRNVLIYFTPEAVQRAAGLLAGALSPDGWLVTGSSDPPLQAQGLRGVRRQAGSVYRRANATPAPPAVPRAARPRAAHRVPLRETGKNPVADVPAMALATGVRALADAGRLEAAAAAATAAVTRCPLDAELRYLLAVILLESGRAPDAVAAARTAVYLDPDLAVAHLALGRAQRASGDNAAARRSFRNARILLQALPADAAVRLGDGEVAGRLAAAAAAHERLGAPTGDPGGVSRTARR